MYNMQKRTLIHFIIKVAKGIKDAKVTIDYLTSETAPNQCKHKSAEFYKDLDNNYSIYKAEINEPLNIAYKIKVQNASEEFIDDNNGENYLKTEIAPIAGIRGYGISLMAS